MEQSFPRRPVAAAGESPSSAATNRAGDRSVKMFSTQSSNLSSGFLTADQLLRAFSNFKKSGAPSRFLIFSEHAWKDVACQVFDELKAGFLAGRTTLDVTVDGKLYLFDLLRMSRIDSHTGRQNSIGWIDVNGRCFFPTNLVNEAGNLSQAMMDSPPKPMQPQCPSMNKCHMDCPKELSDESMEVSSDRWSDAKMLRDDEKLYKVVEKLFLSGIKRFTTGTIITSIHRCSHSSPSSKSRLLSFQLHKRATAVSRGVANVTFGWYGASAGDITDIVSQGFRQPNNGHLGPAAHGIGIHIASPHSPYDSALLSEADEDGERHVILCRVILGNSERVEPGSKQDHPSNDGFDSGVDDQLNPKWYVVWSTHMNTHIIPEYVVSFKLSGHSQGSRKQTGTQRLPPSINLPFWKLFAEIGKSLPSSKMQGLEILYKHFKAGKITKEIFIGSVRSIVGDKLLTSTIKGLKV